MAFLASMFGSGAGAGAASSAAGGAAAQGAGSALASSAASGAASAGAGLASSAAPAAAGAGGIFKGLLQNTAISPNNGAFTNFYNLLQSAPIHQDSQEGARALNAQNENSLQQWMQFLNS